VTGNRSRRIRLAVLRRLAKPPSPQAIASAGLRPRLALRPPRKRGGSWLCKLTFVLTPVRQHHPKTQDSPNWKIAFRVARIVFLN